MSNHLSSTFILVVSVLVLSSCGDGGSEPNIREIDDPSIPIMLNKDGPLIRGPLYTVREDLVLGIDSGEPEWQIFGNSVELLVGDNGWMYLADQPSGIIYIVDYSGELLGQFGARGSGPGEYQLMIGMWWIDEDPEVWIGDARLLRVTRFTPEGELLDTIPYRTRGKSFGNLRQISGNQFLGITSERHSDIRMIQYGFLNENLEWESTFIVLPGQRFFEAFPGSRAPLPFQTIPSVVSLSDGRIVVGFPNEGKITICSRNGDPLFHISRDWEFPAITSEEKDAWFDRASKHIASDRLNKLDLPDRHAAFDFVLTDDKDLIWVHRYGYPQPESEIPRHIFDIFNSAGTWIGTQILEFIPNMVKNGYAYDILRSDEHGPQVIRYKLSELNR